MKRWLAMLAVALAASAALAADAPPPPREQGAAKAASTGPAAVGPGTAAPRVESVDILNQNQAERTRDQPGNAAPVWRKVVAGEAHYSSLPYPESGVLIQPKAQLPGQATPTTAGEAWRRFRNGPMMSIGGWLILGVAAILAAFYFISGPIKVHSPPTGRKIQRFTPLERFVHWTTAITFVLLAISGLCMMFGKFVLMPILGHTLFGYLTYVLKTIHNFVGPLFTVSIVVTFIVYVKDNFPIAADIKWLARLGRHHPPAGRFNAGEKLWFWGGVTFLGLAASASGFVLDKLVPNLEYTRFMMQGANLLHISATVLMMAFALGHIYLGTIGMQGAYDAMREGYVDDAWAREHHNIWYQQVEEGKIPRIRAPEHDGQTVPPPAPKTV
ncbi:formate dehydrogenase subunit gamma [Pseudoduganella sp. OTU4001]|uniref:formate dehydrogenase subunit gamma n=1 Tax=Pseudoduganella sp. OTU4001 TaxID=3043854 RepID=UPI00313E01AD